MIPIQHCQWLVVVMGQSVLAADEVVITDPIMKDFFEGAIASGNAPESLAAVQKKLLVRYREVYGTKLAVQLYGPFIMSFQGAE